MFMSECSVQRKEKQPAIFFSQNNQHLTFSLPPRVLSLNLQPNVIVYIFSKEKLSYLNIIIIIIIVINYKHMCMHCCHGEKSDARITTMIFPMVIIIIVVTMQSSQKLF